MNNKEQLKIYRKSLMYYILSIFLPRSMFSTEEGFCAHFSDKFKKYFSEDLTILHALKPETSTGYWFPKGKLIPRIKLLRKAIKVCKIKKTFTLPKEFAEKWIFALESRDYKQGTNKLYSAKDKTFCCLGVACHIKGIDLDILAGNALPAGLPESYTRNIPRLIMGEDRFDAMLAFLNDGSLEVEQMEAWKREAGIVFHKETTKKGDNGIRVEQYSFKEIARFIKDNVEFV